MFFLLFMYPSDYLPSPHAPELHIAISLFEFYMICYIRVPTSLVARNSMYFQGYFQINKITHQFGFES